MQTAGIHGFDYNLFLCKGDMAQVGLKRQLAPGLHISSVLGISQLGQKQLRELARLSRSWQQRFSLSARGATKGLSIRSLRSSGSSGLQIRFRSDSDQIQIRFRLPAANVQPPRFALRVCEKCVIASGSGHVGMSACPQRWDGTVFRLAAQLETATIRRECSNRQPRWQQRFLGAQRFRTRELHGNTMNYHNHHIYPYWCS